MPNLKDFSESSKAFYRVLYHHKLITPELLHLIAGNNIYRDELVPEPTESEIEEYGREVDEVIDGYSKIIEEGPIDIEKISL